jgi:hypothetical protein
LKILYKDCSFRPDPLTSIRIRKKCVILIEYIP